MNGRMTYVFKVFNNIQAIPGRWWGANEKLCTFELRELRLRLIRFPPPTGIEPGLLDQQVNAYRKERLY